jgi:hypothetical protein
MKLAVGWAMVMVTVFGLAIGLVYATDATGMTSGAIGIGCGVLGILGCQGVRRLVWRR